MNKEEHDDPSNWGLICNANNSSPELYDDSNRGLMYGRLQQLWRISKNLRVRKCRRTRFGELQLHTDGTKGQFVNLTTCGSAIACPVCASSVGMERFSELQGAVEAWGNQGGRFIFQTITIAHNVKSRLSDLHSALVKGFNAINSGKAWSKEAELFGHAGYFKAIECVYNPHSGWNIHIHVLRFMTRQLDDESLAAFEQSMFARYTQKLQKLGMRKPSRKAHKVVQFSSSDTYAKYVPSYLTKQTRSTLQEASGGSLAPFHLLGNGKTPPPANHVKLWREYEAALFGKRMVSWSKGLKSALEDISVSGGLQGGANPPDIEHVLTFDEDSADIVTKNAFIQSRLLTAYQVGGLSELEWFCNQFGIKYSIQSLNSQPYTHEDHWHSSRATVHPDKPVSNWDN